MRDIDLFQLALGLVPPWMVVAANFDAERKRLDIDRSQGQQFATDGAAVPRRACGACGSLLSLGTGKAATDLEVDRLSSDAPRFLVRKRTQRAIISCSTTKSTGAPV
jgi:hypothetical protein